jgi:hypothetical protein
MKLDFGLRHRSDRKTTSVECSSAIPGEGSDLTNGIDASISRGSEMSMTAMALQCGGASSTAAAGWHTCDMAEAYAPFQQPWWLNAVAPGAWDEVRVEQNGKIVARLPFMIKRKFGLTALTQPPLTPFLGPWLSEAAGKYVARLARQKELMLQLIAQLPPYDVCRMQFATELTNWLPFHWSGFVAEPSYTYRIPDLSNEEALWAELDTAERSKIRKVKEYLAIRTDLGIDVLLDLQERTYAKHGWVMPDRELYYRVDEACRARGCCQNIVAEDASGRRHAAYYIIWDERCAYAVGGGLDHDLARSATPDRTGRARSAAASLVKWESIRFAGRVTQSYDFLGSSFEPVERTFRSLGARQTIRLAVSKLNRRARLLSAARALALAVMGRED